MPSPSPPGTPQRQRSTNAQEDSSALPPSPKTPLLHRNAGFNGKRTSPSEREEKIRRLEMENEVLRANNNRFVQQALKAAQAQKAAEEKLKAVNDNLQEYVEVANIAVQQVTQYQATEQTWITALEKKGTETQVLKIRLRSQQQSIQDLLQKVDEQKAQLIKCHSESMEVAELQRLRGETLQLTLDEQDRLELQELREENYKYQETVQNAALLVTQYQRKVSERDRTIKDNKKVIDGLHNVVASKEKMIEDLSRECSMLRADDIRGQGNGVGNAGPKYIAYNPAYASGGAASPAATSSQSSSVYSTPGLELSEIQAVETVPTCPQLETSPAGSFAISSGDMMYSSSTQPLLAVNPDTITDATPDPNREAMENNSEGSDDELIRQIAYRY
ncbi:hypothetical protein P280DRAFT_531194 [Massarina eburnea CBS 473.64]|uniref:Uncharacterized protein n=1 Tax=Massarina eburnea CBS 473.64 TaxID=1395130 RepID=A0A6A6SG38_9PLEO|nr:hypothetical protein P280DRAFT_531194 [Massarina eburnea CBS 473.64]